MMINIDVEVRLIGSDSVIRDVRLSPNLAKCDVNSSSFVNNTLNDTDTISTKVCSTELPEIERLLNQPQMPFEPIADTRLLSADSAFIVHNVPRHVNNTLNTTVTNDNEHPTVMLETTVQDGTRLHVTDSERSTPISDTIPNPESIDFAGVSHILRYSQHPPMQGLDTTDINNCGQALIFADPTTPE